MIHRDTAPPKADQILTEALRARAEAGPLLAGMPPPYRISHAVARYVATSEEAFSLAAWDYLVLSDGGVGIGSIAVDGDVLNYDGLSWGAMPDRVLEALTLAQQLHGDDGTRYHAVMVEDPVKHRLSLTITSGGERAFEIAVIDGLLVAAGALAPAAIPAPTLR